MLYDFATTSSALNAGRGYLFSAIRSSAIADMVLPDRSGVTMGDPVPFMRAYAELSGLGTLHLPRPPNAMADGGADLRSLSRSNSARSRGRCPPKTRNRESPRATTHLGGPPRPWFPVRTRGVRAGLNGRLPTARAPARGTVRVTASRCFRPRLDPCRSTEAWAPHETNATSASSTSRSGSTSRLRASITR